MPQKSNDLVNKNILISKNDPVSKVYSSENMIVSKNLLNVINKNDNQYPKNSNLQSKEKMNDSQIKKQSELLNQNLQHNHNPLSVSKEPTDSNSRNIMTKKGPELPPSKPLISLRSQSLRSNKNMMSRPLPSVEKQKQMHIFSNSKLNTSLTNKSIKGSMVSIRSKQFEGKPTHPIKIDYKEKYEKMKQANKALQEKFDALLKKHERLFQLFQKLESKLASKKEKLIQPIKQNAPVIKDPKSKVLTNAQIKHTR